MGQHASVPASRSSSNGHGTNNLPPLLFHNVCGENIRISREGTVARRAESFCKGIAFSSRPVKVNEKICIKFLEISNNWSGVIRFGFSYNDPSTLRDGLPKYACPDLTNKPGYWAKALPERFCNQGTVLFYYVTAAGDVHFGINNEEKGIFFSGVETRGPLWALIDVYGNSTAIEFVDIRHQLNNARRSQQHIGGSAAQEVAAQEVEVERIICSTQSMNIHRENEETAATMGMAVRYQPVAAQFAPMPLHRTRGRNIRFTNGSRCEAARLESEFCQGYVFTGRPLQLNERIVVQVLATVPMFQGCLGLGLTACDPATLQPGDLPDDSNFLLDRPEYWVISRDFARNLCVGDEISFCVAACGEVQISRNGASPAVVIHVDQTLKLWAFFDVYGSTRRIRVLSQQQGTTNATTPTRAHHMSDRRVITPNSESMNSLNSQSEMRRNSAAIVQQQQQQGGQSRVCCVAPADIQVQPSANGGAVLSLILPPSHANIIAPTTTIVTPQFNSQTSVQQQQHNHNHNHNHHHHNAGQSSHLLAAHNNHSNNYAGGHHNLIVTTSPAPGAMNVITTPTANSTAALLSPSVTVATGTMMSQCSNTYIEPISSTDCHNNTTATTTTSATTPTGSNCASSNNLHSSALYTSTTPVAQSWVEQNGGGGCSGGAYSAGAECTICYEKSIDAVLYMCGHMCMCYECALQQWRGKGGGHCPLCRAVIRDVIRTYKS